MTQAIIQVKEPVRAQKVWTLSVVIPVYNEENTIDDIIERVKSVKIEGVNLEIIVVDDGSKDRTRDILKRIPGIKYIFHEKNQGKGGAVKTGINATRGDIIIFQDADLEYDPKDYHSVIKPIMENDLDLVLGWRRRPDFDPRVTTFTYWCAWSVNAVITLLTNLLYARHMREYEGCYKAIKGDIAKSVKIRTDGFAYDNELTCKIFKAGYKTGEAPIHYYPRGYKDGKKINWRDGFKIIWTIIWYRIFE